jgi:phytanoyl-CoA hydroxylase
MIHEAIEHWREHGFARLGVVANEAELTALRARADALMLGELTYEGLFFQHDSESGSYDDLAYGKGYEGPSLRYRKVEKLEKDPLFWSWITQERFRAITSRVYGEAVTLYRALLMNKHAGGGSNLPWHQDGGTFWGLDQDPQLTIWTGLDDAPLDGGCVEVVPGSHRGGLVTPLGGVVPTDRLGDAESRAMPVPTVAGEVLLLHNQVWHRSARSSSGHPRRALSVCYMDASTQCTRRRRAPRSFVQVF